MRANPDSRWLCMQVKSLKAGDRVVTAFDVACPACSFCNQQLYSSCNTSNPRCVCGPALVLACARPVARGPALVLACARFTLHPAPCLVSADQAQLYGHRTGGFYGYSHLVGGFGKSRWCSRSAPLPPRGVPHPPAPLPPATACPPLSATRHPHCQATTRLDSDPRAAARVQPEAKRSTCGSCLVSAGAPGGGASRPVSNHVHAVTATLAAARAQPTSTA